MDLLEPGSERAPFGLRAMTMIARAAESGISQPQRALLDAAQRGLLHTELDVDSLPAITPDELAGRFDEPALARQLIRGMVVMSLADGPPSRRQTELILSFAAALGVDEPAVKVIHRLMEQDLLLFRLDFYRRSHIRDYIGTQYRTQGGRGSGSTGWFACDGRMKRMEPWSFGRTVSWFSSDLVQIRSTTSSRPISRLAFTFPIGNPAPLTH